MATDLLVVGLGNPGEEYARTRHNVGAEVVEMLAKRHGGRLKQGQGAARSSPRCAFGGHRVALAVPITYMNDSGIAVRKLVRRFDVELDQLVIVHDELDLPPAVAEGEGRRRPRRAQRPAFDRRST